jgi:hypothetical protein
MTRRSRAFFVTPDRLNLCLSPLGDGGARSVTGKGLFPACETDDCQNALNVIYDITVVNAKNPIAQAAEVGVPARIIRSLKGVTIAVQLDNQSMLLTQEVYDVWP